jgi:hypothetical protein
MTRTGALSESARLWIKMEETEALEKTVLPE